MKLLNSRKVRKITLPFIAPALFISLCMVMNSCKKPVFTTENFDASNLRIVNGLPGRANVKFYLDSFNLSMTGYLNFTKASPYYVVKSGLRSAKFYSTVSLDTFARTSIQLDPKKVYSLFLAGDTLTPKYFLTTDDLTEPTSDKAKVRLANLGVTSGNVDVTIQYYDPTDPTLPVQPEIPVFTNVPPLTVSDYVSVTVLASKGNAIKRLHSIKIYTAGTQDLLASISNIDLRATSINTIITTGIGGGSPALAVRLLAKEWLN